MQQKLAEKTVAKMQLYYRTYGLSPMQLADQIPAAVAGMGVAVTKSGGTIIGPVHIIVPAGADGEGAQSEAQLALPVRGAPRPGGRYRTRQAPVFKCIFQVVDSAAYELPARLADFVQAARVQGYELTGETRLVLSENGQRGDRPVFELQLGVK